MSFIVNPEGDLVILRDLVTRISLENDLPHEKCLYLLILYKWNVDALTRDLTSTRSVHGMLPTRRDNIAIRALCMSCGTFELFQTTSCGHLICPECTTSYVNKLVSQSNTRLLCPECENVFLDPFLISHILPTESLKRYHSLLLREMTKNMGSHSPMKKAAQVLWKSKTILAGTLLGLLGLKKFFKWKKNHPDQVQILRDMHEQCKQGIYPNQPGFWTKLAWKERGLAWKAIKKSIKKKFASCCFW